MDFLEIRKQATARELSQVLGMTQANIRHHLSVLLGEGRIEVVGQSLGKGRGRPTFVFMPTKQAQKHSLDLLLTILLDEIQFAKSSKQRENKIRLLAKRLSLTGIDDNISMTIRLGECIQHLNDLHYEAHWEARADFPIITLGRCPYAPIIDHYPLLCTMDKYMLENILFREVEQIDKITRHPEGPQYCLFLIHAGKKGVS